MLLAEADVAGGIDWTVSVDVTITRTHQHATNTTRSGQPTGTHSIVNNRGLAQEPDGHAVGRSRGGLPPKLHVAVDGNGLLLAIIPLAISSMTGHPSRGHGRYSRAGA